MITLRTFPQRVVSQLTGKRATLSIGTWAKGMLRTESNYGGLKLIEKEMKVIDHVVEGLIGQRVGIDEMQCGFMSGSGINGAVLIVCQLQENHLTAYKPFYMAFFDIEDAFDRVPTGGQYASYD